MSNLKNFYKEKKVLLTGHTGFKGSWMAAFLYELGAIVHGYALDPVTNDSLFDKANISSLLYDIRGDVLDSDKLGDTISLFNPEIVFHFAAQPLVIDSYRLPRHTWEVNVIGTLNLLESLKKCDSVKSIVIVTTDKVYKNYEKNEGYNEEDHLGGHDPYSSSKAATEILTESMFKSYFKEKNIGLATARSGNVIGGGDWSENRLLPDYFRAYFNKTSFELRNPTSTRPWQHVLDVVNGYSLLAMKLYHEPLDFSGAWNFGPNDEALTTKEIIEKLNFSKNIEILEHSGNESTFHETKVLSLISTKSKSLLKWQNILDIDESIKLLDELYVNFKSDSFKMLFKSQVTDFVRLIDEV